jgi:hypothetical protein
MLIRTADGKIKGNCDAELVLKLTNDYHTWKFWKALIISSDGDFACLADFLNQNSALLSILSPRNTCSLLLRKLPISITYIDTQRNILEFRSLNEKALNGDETP